MIKKWAKILPYCVVTHIVRKFSPHIDKFKGKIVYLWRIDKGEFVMWNQENYDIMKKREDERQEEKISRRRAKYEKLKGEFEPEESTDDNDEY